jgi:hypothetical protein
MNLRALMRTSQTGVVSGRNRPWEISVRAPIQELLGVEPSGEVSWPATGSLARGILMVPQVRIELTTYPLPRDCATTTLLRQPWYFRTHKTPETLSSG